MTQKTVLKIGTRGSPLALAQAREVRDLLRRHWPELAGDGAVEIVALTTAGDRIQDRPLSDVGGKGVFTGELDDALYDGRIHCAVHSMKDVPTRLPGDIVLSAMLRREDVRDVFVSALANDFSDLPRGGRVGTISMRRQAQILARHPHLTVILFRGNVQTRLRKLADGEADAIMLAMAGLNRLDLAHVATRILEPEDMLPAAGQGAIGVACLNGDETTGAYLAPLNHPDTATCVHAERAMLDVLDGSCRTPIAGYARLSGDGATVGIRGMVAETDGSRSWSGERSGPRETAGAMARDLGADLRAQAGEDFFAALADRGTGQGTGREAE